MGGAPMGWMWLWLVLVLAGLALLAYLCVRLAQSGQGTSLTTPDPPGSAAQRILAERYARGEIDEDEYRRRRDVLP